MRANEFEKQVQQIMGELKLPPSPPVWENIEEQIRKKKDRRRIIFFVLFFFLILSGGLWLTIETGNKKSNNKNARQEEIHTAQHGIATDSARQNEKRIVEQKDQNSFLENPSGAIKETKTSTKGRTRDAADVRQKKIKIPSPSSTNKPGREIAISPATKNNDQFQAAENDTTHQQVSEAMQNADDKQIAVSHNDVQQTQAVSTDSAKENNVKEMDSIAEVAQPIAIMSPQKKTAKPRKWQRQISAELGLSDYSYGLFGGQESLRASYSGSTSAPPPPVPVFPQPIRSGLSARIGVEWSRPLNSRFDFSAGIQYHYLSTHMRMGALVQKDSSINYLSDMIAINSYYQNGNQSNYTNRFHFIEIPVSLRYKLSRQIPLDLGFGFSYGYLVHTNVLSFNSQGNFYYHNKKDYRKNYLDFFTSLQYSWLQRTKFSIQSGPIFSYSLNRLHRSDDNGTPHLFSIGLKTSIKF